MKMEQIDCSETSAYEIQTPGNYPEENIKYSEHGESLKSRKVTITFVMPACLPACLSIHMGQASSHGKDFHGI
jgi:hypothetical protein